MPMVWVLGLGDPGSVLGQLTSLPQPGPTEPKFLLYSITVSSHLYTLARAATTFSGSLLGSS